MDCDEVDDKVDDEVDGEVEDDDKEVDGDEVDDVVDGNDGEGEVGLPSCDVLDDEKPTLDIETLPHAEAPAFQEEKNIHVGVADPAAVTDDHPLAWSGLSVQPVMNEY